jgi:hypothetical protein
MQLGNFVWRYDLFCPVTFYYTCVFHHDIKHSTVEDNTISSLLHSCSSFSPLSITTVQHSKLHYRLYDFASSVSNLGSRVCPYVKDLSSISCSWIYFSTQQITTVKVYGWLTHSSATIWALYIIWDTFKIQDVLAVGYTPVFRWLVVIYCGALLV